MLWEIHSLVHDVRFLAHLFDFVVEPSGTVVCEVSPCCEEANIGSGQNPWADSLVLGSYLPLGHFVMKDLGTLQNCKFLFELTGGAKVTPRAGFLWLQCSLMESLAPRLLHVTRN